MKWTALRPVIKGQVIQMTVCGHSGLYEVLKHARCAMDLQACDLKLVERD